MSEQTALLVWVHRANIERYRRLMATHLTSIERQFIARRIREEQAELREAGALVECADIASEITRLQPADSWEASRGAA